MTEEIIFTFYIISLFLYVCVETTLVLFNLKSAKQLNPELEKSLMLNQDEATKLKSYNYTKDKSYLHIISIFISSIAVLAFINFQIFGYIDSILRTHIDNFYILGCVYIFSVTAVFSIIQLPLELFSTFIIEEKYGFNKMTFSLWLKDSCKAILLSLLIMTPLVLAILYFINTFSNGWWLYAFIAIFLFQILLMIIYPSIIAPLFNKFEKLQDETLGEKINTLAKQVNFETQGIYQIDGSTRSAHANAYFAGFGKGRRIVLFDTLINKLSHDEICAVLAHEIGHAKKHHIIKSVLFSGIILLLGLFFASVLLTHAPFFHAFGIENPSSYTLLILFSIAFEPISFFISPLMSSLSRKNEFEADAYAIQLVGTTKTLEKALLTLSIDSLSNLNPHPWYSFFHYSHPTLLERIKAMRNTVIH